MNDFEFNLRQMGCFNEQFTQDLKDDKKEDAVFFALHVLCYYVLLDTIEEPIGITSAAVRFIRKKDYFRCIAKGQGVYEAVEKEKTASFWIEEIYEEYKKQNLE